MALYEIKEEKERVILVGVSTRENDDTEDSLDELKEIELGLRKVEDYSFNQNNQKKKIK